MENNNLIRLYGKVSDFNGNLLADAEVRIMNDQFEDLYVAHTNTNGEYEIKVKKGLYYNFYACKDYSVNYLEYWGWNLPLFEDLEINPRIDALEIYGLNAFKIQGGVPALTLYFRPMTLKRARQLEEDGSKDCDKKVEKKYVEIFDIAPKLKKEDIKVQIDGVDVEVYHVNRTLEYVGLEEAFNKPQYMPAYMIQVALGEDYNSKRYEYKKINVEVVDSETNEKGEASVFWKEEVTSK